LEQPVVNAGAVGGGIRSSIDVGWSRNVNIEFELARKFTDVAILRQGWRANLSAVLVF
jgi:hypothetical protein